MISKGLATSLRGIDFSKCACKTAKAASSVLSANDFQKVLMNNLQSPAAGHTSKTSAPFPMPSATTKLDSSVSDVLFLQSLNNGANLIGKTITYEKAGSSVPAQGKVDGVSVNEGKLFLLVGGNLVPLSQVRGIVAHAS